jgi:predicted CoA-binding protein
MEQLEEAVEDFLSQSRIAVAGVSRNSMEASHQIFRKLQSAGRVVYPINPRTSEIAGEPCYPDLASLPHPVDALMIATPPAAAKELVNRCAELGISRVWMHRSFGTGSVSDDAVELCRQHGIRVIAGACPMMFCKPVDIPHRCLRWILKVTGGLPNPE